VGFLFRDRSVATALASSRAAASFGNSCPSVSRLARWLLRAADLRGSDELPLTQEYIAQMLGVRRTSVTVVARTLQEAGMIRYKRGHINLIDVPALQETACECYHTVKMNYDALLHPSNR
jgi:CRP-like cAMP-binding protein